MQGELTLDLGSSPSYMTVYASKRGGNSHRPVLLSHHQPRVSDVEPYQWMALMKTRMIRFE